MTREPQYEIERREATEATVRVTLAPELFRESLDGVYRRYAREVRIPGFRKGHVPRNVLERHFGRELFVEEAREDLQRHHLPEALLALDLRPVSRPRVETTASEPSEPFVFRASFSVLPEIDLPAIRGREVRVPPPPDVSQEDIESALKEVQGHLATLGPKEGTTVAEGDIVHVREGKKEWDARVAEDDAVTQPLIGASVGDKVAIDVEVGGKRRLRTTLEVLGLREVILPEIDDELAKDAGFDSLDALKDDIVEKITAARAERHRQLIEASVMEQVVEAVQVELPAPFVDELTAEELERVKASFEDSAEAGSYEEYLASHETTEEALLERIRDNVERRLRRELVVRRIAEVEGIAIDDAELEGIAQEEAQLSGEDPLRFVGRLKANDRWDDYRSSKVNERVFALLREHAVVKEAEAEAAPGRIIDPSKRRPGQGLIIDPTKEGGGS